MVEVVMSSLTLAVANCAKIAPKRPSLKSLAHVKLDVSRTAVTLEATDLDRHIRCTVPTIPADTLSAHEPWSVMLFAPALSSAVRGLKWADCRISLSTDLAFVVFQDPSIGACVTVPVSNYTTEEFPRRPDVNPDGLELSLAGGNLTRAVKMLEDYVSTDMTRPSLSHVHVTEKYMTATNGSVACRVENCAGPFSWVVTKGGKVAESRYSMVVPFSTLSTVSKLVTTYQVVYITGMFDTSGGRWHSVNHTVGDEVAVSLLDRRCPDDYPNVTGVISASLEALRGGITFSFLRDEILSILESVKPKVGFVSLYSLARETFIGIRDGAEGHWLAFGRVLLGCSESGHALTLNRDFLRLVISTHDAHPISLQAPRQRGALFIEHNGVLTLLMPCGYDAAERRKTAELVATLRTSRRRNREHK